MNKRTLLNNVMEALWDLRAGTLHNAHVNKCQNEDNMLKNGQIITN